MIVDYCICSSDIKEIEIKESIRIVSQYSWLASITVPFYLIKQVKGVLTRENIQVSCLIDYPLGMSDAKTRCCAIQQALKNNTDTIDIVMPQNLASNRKYDKIRDDIKSMIDITESPTKIRYILEYRNFDHNCLKKICEICESFQIKNIFPSTGFFIDNLSDNILASIFLHKNSKEINIFCTGNLWTDTHFETINKSGLLGFRTYSQSCLKNYNDYYFKHSGV